MPLTRYEIRNEYSLANPDLYRAASKDDPEGLLEGVAMAGLVGIVRQLGDLAEFAAEVFHDLHEQVLATAARGHELLLRVQQLEVELPVVERLMLAETNHVYYAYNPGVEWHASMRNDQNHFTQGDLPRFIRNAYEDCRGPPRLFLLDKFDVAGAGACLKRYTDPSFFKTEWARLELLKAEKEHQDKRARRIKRKGRRRQIGKFREGDFSTHLNLRKPLDLGKASVQFDSKKIDETDSTLNFDVNTVYNKDVRRLPGQGFSSQVCGSELHDRVEKETIEIVENYALNKSKPDQDLEENERTIENHALDELASDQVLDHLETMEEVNLMTRVEANMQTEKDAKLEDDAASETDQYVDALATMDSEVETDSEFKMKVEADACFSSDEREQSYVPSISKTSNELDTQDGACLETEVDNGDFSYTLRDLSANSAFESLRADIELNDEILEERESSACQGSLDMSENLALKELNEASDLDENRSSPKMKERQSPVHATTPLSLSEDRDIGFYMEENMESGTNSCISETPQTSELQSQADNLSSVFSQFPTSVIVSHHEDEIEVIDNLNPAGSVDQDELKKLSNGGLVLERESGLESEPGDISEVLSTSPSSAGASMHPIKWNMGLNDAYSDVSASDNDIHGMQVSSGSLSLSSSTLSSPRPSTLATKLFHIDDGSKLSSLFSSQESSPKSLTGRNISNDSPRCISPRSLTTTEFGSPQSPVNKQSESPVHSTCNGPLCLHDSNLGASLMSGPQDATDSLESVTEAPLTEEYPVLTIDESEESPPPPPLPPMEWLMVMKTHNHVLSSFKRSSASPPSHPVSSLGSGKHPHNAGDEYVANSMTRKEDMLELSDASDSMTRKKDMLEYSNPTSLDTTIVKEEVLADVIDKVPLKKLSATVFQPSLLSVSSLMVEPESPNEESLQCSDLAQNSMAEISTDLPSSSMPDVDIQDNGYQELPQLSRKDSLIEAIAAHDRNSLRKVADWGRTSSHATSSDDRQVLLEQIRTGSFSLRHTKVEREEASRPVTSINVAAILEKANAIRQAFIGSDEEEDDDDDWSDS